MKTSEPPANSKALAVTLQRRHPTFDVRVAPGGFGVVIERKDDVSQSDIANRAIER